MATSSSKTEAMIDKLPAELAIDVMSYLRPHDLTQLARASKRYREFAQSALWTSIELHRQDAHDNCFILSHKQPPRVYLDDDLLHPWCYRNYDGVDAEYDTRNEQFRAAIREMYAPNGNSEAWDRIKPVVRHICLTVTHESPPQIWNMILSLPNLRTIEVIGEYSEDRRGPPTATALGPRKPEATSVQNVRLRGYVPVEFVSAICRASASTIVSLDLGVLDEPEFFRGPEDAEVDFCGSCPVYIGPRGSLWHDATWPEFTSLTHLLLCRPGSSYGFRERRGDLDYEASQMQQWASLLQAVRSTAVEVVLEYRRIFVDHDVEFDSATANEETKCPHDIRFREMVLQRAFAGKDWPNLKKLKFRGISSARGDYWPPEAAPDESLQDSATKLLPGVQIDQVLGNFMFLDTARGTILTHHGADGLKLHLEFDGKYALDDLYDSDNFMDDDEYEFRNKSIDYLYHLSTHE